MAARKVIIHHSSPTRRLRAIRREGEMHHRRMQLLQNRPPKWNHRWQNRQINDNRRKTLAPQYHSSRQLDPQVRETNEYTTSMGMANTSSIAPSTNIKTEREDSTTPAITNRKNTSTQTDLRPMMKQH
jgi:hypothetical protein